MATVVDIGSLVKRTPGIRGGRPHVAGTGVTVRRIVGMAYWEGLSPEQIVEQMPHLSLAHIHAALAYYHANREQMDREIAEEEAEERRIEEEWRRSHGRT
jgi:uncharacterized protein (DUF433 family)